MQRSSPHYPSASWGPIHLGRRQRELAGSGALVVAPVHRALGRLALPPPRPACCALLWLATWRAPATTTATAVRCAAHRAYAVISCCYPQLCGCWHVLLLLVVRHHMVPRPLLYACRCERGCGAAAGLLACLGPHVRLLVGRSLHSCLQRTAATSCAAAAGLWSERRAAGGHSALPSRPCGSDRQ